MATEITIHVTDADIKHGQPRNSHTCPLGRALRREFPKANEVYVLYRHAFVQPEPDGDYLRARLSPRAAAFVNDFDNRSASITRRPRQYKLRFEPNARRR